MEQSLTITETTTATWTVDGFVGVMSPTMMVIPTSTHMSGPQNIYDVKKNGQCTIVKDLNQNTSVTYSTNLSPSQDTRTHSMLLTADVNTY